MNSVPAFWKERAAAHRKDTRASFPAATAFGDELRKRFPAARTTHAIEGGREFGESIHGPDTFTLGCDELITMLGNNARQQAAAHKRRGK